MTPPIIPQEQSSVSGLLQNLVLSFPGHIDYKYQGNQADS